MVAPVVAAAGISAGGGILSALLGRDNTAAQTAALNFYEQQRANRERERLARQQFDIASAPTVSPTGSSSGYNPLTGRFETDLSTQDQALLDLQQSALFSRLGPEESQRQVVAEDQFDQARNTNQAADAAFRSLDDELPFTAEEAFGSAQVKNQTETNRLFDRGMESLLAGMRARGESPVGALTRAIGERSAALKQNAPTRFDARVDAQTLNQGVQNNRLQRALTAAQGVRAPGAGSLSLPGLDNSVNALASSRNATLNGAGALTNSVQAPQMQGAAVDNTDALRVGSISNSLSGLLGAIGQRQSSNGPTRQLNNTKVDNSSAPSGTFNFSGLPGF